MPQVYIKPTGTKTETKVNCWAGRIGIGKRVTFEAIGFDDLELIEHGCQSPLVDEGPCSSTADPPVVAKPIQP